MHILSLSKFHGYFIYMTTNDIKQICLPSCHIYVSMSHFDYCQNLMCIFYDQGSCTYLMQAKFFSLVGNPTVCLVCYEKQHVTLGYWLKSTTFYLDSWVIFVLRTLSLFHWIWAIGTWALKSDSTLHIELGTDTKNILKCYEHQNRIKSLYRFRGSQIYIW